MPASYVHGVPRLGGGAYHAVPVHLSHSSLLEVHLRRGDVVARRKVRDHLLAHPTALKDARPRVREAPLEVGDVAAVCRLATQVVRVLVIDLLVGPACKPGSVLTQVHSVENFDYKLGRGTRASRRLLEQGERPT